MPLIVLNGLGRQDFFVLTIGDVCGNNKLWRDRCSFIFIRLTFSSLFRCSGKVPFYCSFPSFTNSIDFGQGLTVPFTILSGLGPLDFLVLT